MWDLLVILSLFVINTRSCDSPTHQPSPPLTLSQDSKDTTEEDSLGDLGIKLLDSEKEYNLSNDEEKRTTGPEYSQAEPAVPLQDSLDSHQEVGLMHKLQGLRYQGPSLFGNANRDLPWKQIYTNLRMRGKRSSDPFYPPWEVIYSLRGKKTVANLPWQMGLQSPMLRGKKSAPYHPWKMGSKSSFWRRKKSTEYQPGQMDLQSLMFMLRGKKADSSLLPWKMSLQSPMLRGKKTKTLVNLPWKMDLKSPMLRGKKGLTTTVSLKNGANMEETKANLPWAFDYLSPMIRG